MTFSHQKEKQGRKPEPWKTGQLESNVYDSSSLEITTKSYDFDSGYHRWVIQDSLIPRLVNRLQRPAVYLGWDLFIPFLWPMLFWALPFMDKFTFFGDIKWLSWRRNLFLSVLLRTIGPLMCETRIWISKESSRIPRVWSLFSTIARPKSGCHLEWIFVANFFPPDFQLGNALMGLC